MMFLYKSLLAGLMIGLGAYANTRVGGIFGSILFSLGLLSVIRFGLPLYTGLVSKRENYKDMDNMLLVLAINFAGAAIFSLLSIDSGIDKLSVIAGKLDKSVLQVVFDSIMCGICVSIAVKSKDTLMVLLAVALFVICGGEHCVADMFMFSFTSQPLSIDVFLFLFLVVIGNTIGGLVMLRAEIG